MRHAVILFPALLLACDSKPAAPAVLKFTAIPGDRTTELREKFAPFEKYLSDTLGVKAEYVPTADYNASVDAFVNGQVQLAWFGGLTGVRAGLAVPGARAIAQGKVDPEYHSYFIAHKDAGVDLSDGFPTGLAGKKFTFGSESSTSGRLMPEYFIRHSTGKSPREFFGAEMSFSGNHEKTAQLVTAGTFDAGAIDYKTYDRLVAEKKIDPAVCRIVWKTPPYPDYHWMAHPSLGDATVAKLQAALIAIKDDNLLEAINRKEGLIPAKNEDWNALRDLARELGLVR